MIQVSEESKIVVCPKCKGKGTRKKEVFDHYNTEVTINTCEYCSGYRVIIETIKICHTKII